jgi:hypothetical protein
VSPARLAARCLALLGPVDGPVAVHAPGRKRLRAALATRATPPRDGAPPAGAIVAFLGVAGRAAEREPLLRRLLASLPHDAPLVLVDYNQPRTGCRRLLAWLPLYAEGFGPGRARYPAARELAALGFRVERLRLASGERIQLVLARGR